MNKQKIKLQHIRGGIIAVVGCIAAAMPGWAVDPVIDNQVQAVTYFPTPYVAYNNIYIGKKLDIGVAGQFTANLGSIDCNTKNSLKSTGELPSLWLPATNSSNAAVTPTPLFLRSQKPDGNNITSNLNISGLNAPLYVTTVEVGQRDATGNRSTGESFALTNPHTTMGNVSIQFANLVLGTDTAASSTLASSTLENLTVSRHLENMTVKVNSEAINFPGCSVDNKPVKASWQPVLFKGTTITAMVCGDSDSTKEPFTTTYSCDPSGNVKVRCEVNNNLFYCDRSICTTNYYRWNLQATQSGYLKARGHKRYCDWLAENPGASSNSLINQLGIYAMQDTVDEQWYVNECPSTVNTSWNTTQPSGSFCYSVTQKPTVGDVTCLDTSSNPNANYTEVPGARVTYNYYTSEPYPGPVDCEEYCTSFN